MIVDRSAEQSEIEKEEKYRLDLRELNLTGGHLLNTANLINADLLWSDLDGAQLGEANLANANLFGACLSGTYLKGCKGLTQEQVDQASAEPDNPPNLEGMVDAETGKPLVWRVEAAKQT